MTPAPALDSRSPAPTDPVYTHREAWLQALVAEIRPWFEDLGSPVPPVRVSVGFTSKGLRSNRVGECWYGHATGDGVPEVFLHPGLLDSEVPHVLVHELCHAALGPEAKHGPRFRRLATALGLTGRMTATVPTDALSARLNAVVGALGPFPGAALRPGTGTGPTSTGPKQSTRMLKAACPTDGYLVRLTRRWADLGLPSCPLCSETLALELEEP